MRLPVGPFLTRCDMRQGSGWGVSVRMAASWLPARMIALPGYGMGCLSNSMCLAGVAIEQLDEN